jgi:hypothetical protein
MYAITTMKAINAEKFEKSMGSEFFIALEICIISILAVDNIRIVCRGK